MSSRVTLGAVSLVVALAAVGCSGFVPRAEHDREIEALKAYTEQLEKANSDLQKMKVAYKELLADYKISQAEQELYDQLAKDLATLLKGMKVDGSDVAYNAQEGKWTFGADLLFSSGSDDLSTKGLETLKKFAETYRAQGFRFRVVGHTDKDPIVRAGTTKDNPTKMNLELGMNRSVAVAFALAKNGIAEKRMMLESQGNNSPVAPNDSRSDNKKRNRRVEIFLLPDGTFNAKTPGK